MKFGTLPLMHNAVAESNLYNVFQVRTIYLLQSELLSESLLVIRTEAGLHRPGLYNIISAVQL